MGFLLAGYFTPAYPKHLQDSYVCIYSKHTSQLYPMEHFSVYLFYVGSLVCCETCDEVIMDKKRFGLILDFTISMFILFVTYNK